MKVIPVSPYGYCLGVKQAMELALSTKKEHPAEKVYLLGALVHNEDAVKRLLEAGLLLLDERKAPLKEQLEKIPAGSVVIYSAHGHPKEYERLASSHGLLQVDSTCPYVNGNLALGLSVPGPLLYLGVKGHLEAEAFLANRPSSSLYDVKTGEWNPKEIQGTPTLLAQTTLGEKEIEEAIRRIHAVFPEAKLLKGRCLSTERRQSSLLEVAHSVDAMVILGSKSSNNSVELARLASSFGADSYLCLNEKEVEGLDLSSYASLGLASGASVDEATFLKTLSYLESL